MSLVDISELGSELKKYFLQNTDWPEVTFNNSDKVALNELPSVEKVESHSIKFQSENNIIFVPSQYISFAVKIKPFATELKKYSDSFDNIKALNDKNVLGEFINNNGDLTNTGDLDLADLELFKSMFASSEHQLNFGAKSILNGTPDNYKVRGTSDFFGSVILKIINVPDASSAKLGSLIYSLTQKPDVYDYLETRFSGIQTSGTINNEETLNTIYYGAPGTGKSFKVNETLKVLDKKYYERITFHPEYDNACFVGGYKPISRDGEIKYEFVPQVFTNIYTKAWLDLDNQYYLAIEEINRGNCAEIFGDIFQLLDRNSNYDVTPSSELQEHLIAELGVEHSGIKSGLKLPPNLRLLATMNTSDQSLFPMDSAFKRRWNWEYIPICYDDIPENESFEYRVKIDEATYFKWIDFIKNVNAIIKTNPNLGMDKCIGNYFIKSDSKEISLKEFTNKAIFYLWNDVFKDEDSSDSIFAKDVSYEDFFPVETNGKDEVMRILEALKIGTIVKATI
ncbi:McrB family protein [Flavobacterium sp. HJJ]|uniref:McrB family protein n=1 Tax=Flavobacterium sp. HJJ TaxID=2783792 RepID=UPI00188A62EE|nr:AAA family ATPase [Flavobacterium sp. HJJ]MBF4470736.1 AAA family ATPase [Flavobacterium sp. HJJ]